MQTLFQVYFEPLRCEHVVAVGVLVHILCRYDPSHRRHYDRSITSPYHGGPPDGKRFKKRSTRISGCDRNCGTVSSVCSLLYLPASSDFLSAFLLVHFSVHVSRLFIMSIRCWRKRTTICIGNWYASSCEPRIIKLLEFSDYLDFYVHLDKKNFYFMF